jgi:uncharacterized protein
VLRLTLSDTILLVALVGVAPAYSYYAGLRIARGAMGSRSRAYGRTMLSWWLIASTMLFLWWRLGRPFARLGLVVPLDTRSVAGAAVCVLAIALVALQLRSAKRMPPERLSQLHTSFGPTLAVLPRTRAEYRLFLALSLTAGICEELLYRGYFLAVASTFLTLAGAVVAGAILFGAGHAYQGRRGVTKTALAGFVFSLIYVSTGSLLWPIALHSLVDIAGGTIGYRVIRVSEQH